ncbi:MAG: hypothetical protein OEV00_06400 [Acidobacteriota bacterium]|nr:hypothetical protein [Acidobacteriota bacterium]MDH3784941.1 hypothetical protein [Acidobacteriota bacterium]
MTSLYERLADLPVTIDGYRLHQQQIANGGWTRLTTTVCLQGGGHDGLGEDVNYSADEQRSFLDRGATLNLAGTFTLDDFSRHLDTLDLFPAPPESPASRNYRRWAFESAALDLALRQSDTTLAEILQRRPQPVRFAASMSLGNPPSVEPVLARRIDKPSLEVKIDYDASWTPHFVDRLGELGNIRVVDLKGLYVGSFSGPPPHPAMYKTIAEGLPDAILEDPADDAECARVLGPHRDRVSWDANIHSIDDLKGLPYRPTILNMKPSRFGRLRTLFDAYDHFLDASISLYGGGQYELGVGRGQIQYLASLFHGDAPNDVAPVKYHSLAHRKSWPDSPLSPSIDPSGFRWHDASLDFPA